MGKRIVAPLSIRCGKKIDSESDAVHTPVSLSSHSYIFPSPQRKRKIETFNEAAQRDFSPLSWGETR